MKILIAYPPLSNSQGCPTIGQNRQFQYFKEPTFIYPVVPASAATLLKHHGHDVTWLDCLAEGIDRQGFFARIREASPELIALEVKTPVISQLWKAAEEIKKECPGAKVVFYGDHVTALPEESFKNSPVDYVITGGDYDFLLNNLCAHLSGRPSVALEKGIYFREGQAVRSTGAFQLDHDLNSLPFIDRDLTKWRQYAYANGNYKRTPGTYVMSGRDCWWGKCAFCSWPTLYPKFRSRSAANVLDEVSQLVERYQVREIMDDAGCFPAGEWLASFCRGMCDRGLNKKVYYDCNMRFGALSAAEFKMMKKANFRLLLFGLESANQSTLDRINKNVRIEQVVEDCRNATKAGLFPHITIMFGYPWETYADARKTLELGTWLLKKGYAYTMQATVVIPYPGTPLYKECREKGWLRHDNWEAFDMKRQVMATDIPDEKMFELVQGMYRVSFNPEFLLRKLFSVRDLDDARYFARAARKVFGHLFDFHARR